MSYLKAQTILNGENIAEVPGQTATTLHRITDGPAKGDILVRYHETAVVTLHLGGEYTLRTGGWPTKTTRERIEFWCPVVLLAGTIRTRRTPKARAEDWTVAPRPGTGSAYSAPVEFEEGIRIDNWGRVADFNLDADQLAEIY